jgi:hypothetical protein
MNEHKGRQVGIKQPRVKQQPRVIQKRHLNSSSFLATLLSSPSVNQLTLPFLYSFRNGNIDL